MAERGILFVVSAPSGTGKSTVTRGLLAELPELGFSVSYTTRRPRAGEVDGRQYHFVDETTFRTMVAQGAFLEWATVFGHCYGTGVEETRRALDEGRQLLLDIDVEGARQVRGATDAAVSIMLLPPDFATLERRLRRRGSESAAQLGERLGRARREAEDYHRFDYLVVNHELDETVAELRAIVRAERCRSERAGERAAAILATFPT